MKSKTNLTKEQKEQELINNLATRFATYKQSTNTISVFNSESNSKIMFGTAFNAWGLIVILAIFDIAMVCFIPSIKPSIAIYIAPTLFAIILHAICIPQIITNFKESHIIEKTKATYTTDFNLYINENSVEPYCIDYYITTPITGTIKQKATLTKETFDYLFTLDKIPLSLTYGRGFDYSLDFKKIYAQKIKDYDKYHPF